MARVRSFLAHLLWWGCVACALVLAAGALLVALEASVEHAAVELVLRGADALDLGVFSRADGLVQVSGRGTEVKEALANWGLAALVWLIVGRVADRVVRPGSS